MKAVISGAGVGGLTAAVGLARAGWQVQVLESAEVSRPVGAGLLLQPNAMRALAELGLDEEVAARGNGIVVGSMQHFGGKTLKEMDLTFGGKRRGAVAIHRATLHRLLLELLGEHAVEWGVAVEGVAREAFSTSAGLHSGDLLLAADGIRSRVAESLGCPPIRYAGYTCWRGVTEAGTVESLQLQAEQLSEIWGPAKRFGIVPIERGRVYWFATDSRAPGGDEVSAESLGALFESFPETVRQLIAMTPSESILRNDIIDRAPRRAWGHGALTLLGDAAHPMTPNLGQGAGQAIEDAACLVRCLQGASAQEVPARLREYEAERIPKSTKIVEASLKMGKIGQLRNPLMRWLRDRALAWTPDSITEKQVLELTG